MKNEQMKKEYRLLIKKGDIVVSAIVLIFAIVLGLTVVAMLKNTGKGSAIIMQNGETLHIINLDEIVEPITITIDEQYHNVIVAEKGRIHMNSSSCPGESCVHTGWISDSGKTIVCLPNRVEIKISGVDSEVDAVVS